jgi:hypothetical protein
MRAFLPASMMYREMVCAGCGVQIKSETTLRINQARNAAQRNEIRMPMEMNVSGHNCTSRFRWWDREDPVMITHPNYLSKS